jgi:cell filamentation protein
MNCDPYVYSGTTILRNRLGIKNAAQLNAFERHVTAQRAAEGVPAGNPDLSHLQAIHRHLFQDVYEWAGQIRTVELNKGRDQFMFRQYIQTGMADVHRRIVKANYFKTTSQADFAAGAGEIIGDINYLHPFREGNGRTQLLCRKQLSIVAGHSLSQPDQSGCVDRGFETRASGRIRCHGSGNPRGSIINHQALPIAGPRARHACCAW